MGDQKLLTKFRQFCEDYGTEYAFEATVEGFDTIDIVDPERLTRGFYVSRGKVRSLVGLYSRGKPPVEIGDAVIVAGRDARREENRVVPAVILIPKGHSILFSSEIKYPTIRGFVIFFSPLIAASIVMLLYGLLIPLEYSLTYSWIFLLGISLFLSWFPAMSYLEDYLKRPRLFHCDEDTWQSLAKEVASKYDIMLGV
ncbi:MAG: hypothetical protein OEV85_01305 [Candidatus Thorarchaeota archaeon]|nr:hypothetical protein [Candidatus Thorarchaeota archaeon]